MKIKSVKIQAISITVYFCFVHLLGLIVAISGYMNQYPEIAGLYMLMSYPIFVLMYFKKHLDFSSQLERERSDLFDKHVLRNPLAPNRKWFVKLSGVFSTTTYKSLTGELAELRILFRNCTIYMIVSFILVILITLFGILR